MDERKFTDVVKSIASSEKDVDKVLEAARLLRHEGESRKLGAEQKAEIIISAMILFGGCAFMTFLYFLLTSAVR